MTSDLDSSSFRVMASSPVDIPRYGEMSSVRHHGRYVTGIVARYGQFCFVKGLAAQWRHDIEAQALLRKEFDLMVQLGDDATVKAIDFDEIPGLGHVIVMERINGLTLDEWLAKSPSRRKRKLVAQQIVDAVARIHRREVVHRDLKTDNIMVISGESPEVKLIDFSLADSDRMLFGKEPGGNAAYGAPEQFRPGSKARATDDVYALGRLLKELNVGVLWRLVSAKCRDENPKHRPADGAGVMRLYNRLRAFVLAVAIAIAAIAFWFTYHCVSNGTTDPQPAPAYGLSEMSPTLSGTADDATAKRPADDGVTTADGIVPAVSTNVDQDRLVGKYIAELDRESESIVNDLLAFRLDVKGDELGVRERALGQHTKQVWEADPTLTQSSLELLLQHYQSVKDALLGVVMLVDDPRSFEERYAELLKDPDAVAEGGMRNLMEKQPLDKAAGRWPQVREFAGRK